MSASQPPVPQSAAAADAADLAQLTRFRRDLHRIPELDFDLPKTIAYVTRVLEGLSCRVFSPCPSCVCAFFDADAACGRPTGATPATAVRADMDALPICEKSGAPFASEHPGKMHACGHDGHMAMALAAACWVDDQIRAVAADAAAGAELGAADEGGVPADRPHGGAAAGAVEKRRPVLPRNVLFVFQPAEETTGGAKTVCESGVFERYRVDRIFGFHLWPDLPAGVVASRPGALLARSSETTLTVHGVSSHIAKHREGRDALLAAARFVCAADQATAALNDEDPEDPCLLKFGHMTSGTVRNAIAAEAVVEGSLRVFSDGMSDRAREAVRVCAEEACASCGCTYDLRFSEGYPPVVNDRQLFAQVAEALGAACGAAPDEKSAAAAASCVDGEPAVASLAAGAASGGPVGASGLELVPEPLLIAEDFAFYQRHVPGVFFLLGTGTGIPLHADAFNFDERVLLRGLDTYRLLLQMP